MILERFSYTETETMGRLIAGDWRCWTIERAWQPSKTPGGLPFHSCVPDGRYDLVRYRSPKRGPVLCLINPALGVFMQEYDRHEDRSGSRVGRYMIQIHPANMAHELAGCIAPGRTQIQTADGPAVRYSRDTFDEMMKLEPKTLEIRPALGTVN